MPRLHERIDGSYYIRIFRGEDKETGELFIGTWQLSAKGEDRLRSYGIHFDDDHIPMHVFEELRANREIWHDGSIAPPRPKRRKHTYKRKKSSVPASPKTRQTSHPAPRTSRRPTPVSQRTPPPPPPSRQQADHQSDDPILRFIDWVKSLFR